MSKEPEKTTVEEDEEEFVQKNTRESRETRGIEWVNNLAPGEKIGKENEIRDFEEHAGHVAREERESKDLVGQAFLLVQSPTNPNRYIPAEVFPKHLGEGRFDLDGQTETARGIREGVRELARPDNFSNAMQHLSRYLYFVSPKDPIGHVDKGVAIVKTTSTQTGNKGLLFNVYDEDRMLFDSPSRQEVILTDTNTKEGFVHADEEVLARQVMAMLVKLNVPIQVPLMGLTKESHAIDEEAMKRLVEDDALETNLESTRLQGVYLQLDMLQTGTLDDTRYRLDDSVTAEPKRPEIKLKDFDRQLARMERMLARPYHVTNNIETQKRLNKVNHCKTI